MLNVYIINIFIYFGTRPVLSSFWLSKYKNHLDIKVSVWFQFQIFRSVFRFRAFLPWPSLTSFDEVST